MEEEFKNKTETELLRLVHKINEQHVMVKNDIEVILDQIDELASKYEQEKVKLEIIENSYVELMKEINNRKNVV